MKDRVKVWKAGPGRWRVACLAGCHYGTVVPSWEAAIDDAKIRWALHAAADARRLALDALARGEA